MYRLKEQIISNSLVFCFDSNGQLWTETLVLLKIEYH
jgi:hypothetical protein